MNPHIGNVAVGDVVGKPFVAAFVYYDEIELHTPATTAEIHSHIPIFESVAVGYRTLVLHSEVRNMHQFVSIAVKRIRPKPVFKRGQRSVRFERKMIFCLRKITTQYVVIAGKQAVLTGKGIGEMNIISDVDIDAVVVDGIEYYPVKSLASVVVDIGSFESSV